MCKIEVISIVSRQTCLGKKRLVVTASSTPTPAPWGVRCFSNVRFKPSYPVQKGGPKNMTESALARGESAMLRMEATLQTGCFENRHRSLHQG